jgi:predicted nuclease of predicted toxin-antitoxin system
MKFLVDRCAGRRLAEWLRLQGHDVREAREGPPDPGDAALLRLAFDERRILLTLDTDFGSLVYLGGEEHTGIVRLPDVPVAERIALMEQLLSRHTESEIVQAVVVVRGNRIRFSRPPTKPK